MFPSRDSWEAVNGETDGHKIVYFLVLPMVENYHSAATLNINKYLTLSSRSRL